MNQANENKLKVLIFISALGIGGAERQLSRLISYFDRTLFDIQIAYCNNKGFDYPGKIIEQSDIKLTYLDRAKWGRLTYFKNSRKFFRDNKFDIVHAWSDTANLYGRVPAILENIPVIFGGMRGWVGTNRLVGFIYSLTNLNCSGWIVNSEAIKKAVKKRILSVPKVPFYVIPNGVELTGIDYKLDQQVKYDTLRTGRPVIGIVGRLDPEKNHLLFLEAAKRVTDLGVQADYWIIGQGSLKDKIQKKIRQLKLTDCVKMLGNINDVDVALKRMDMFVLTSDSEGCPNALLEGMRASLPVISTNCGSLGNIVENGKNGFLVPRNNVEILAKKIQYLILNKKIAIEMGKRGQGIVEQRFNIQNTVNAFQRVYIKAAIDVSNKNQNLKRKLEELQLI
jgi:glycosyltransferase involved in cell wall biosynthesis